MRRAAAGCAEGFAASIAATGLLRSPAIAGSIPPKTFATRLDCHFKQLNVPHQTGPTTTLAGGPIFSNPRTKFTNPFRAGDSFTPAFAIPILYGTRRLMLANDDHGPSFLTQGVARARSLAPDAGRNRKTVPRTDGTKCKRRTIGLSLMACAIALPNRCRASMSGTHAGSRRGQDAQQCASC
jgi:hypothetical protein